MEITPFSTRLHEIYRILPDAGKRDLDRYLASPYFTGNKNLLKLHRFLCEPQLAETHNKNAAWNFTFPKSAYNEKKFRYLVSDLIAAVDDFIYTQQILYNKPRYTHLLGRYYTMHEAAENKAALGNRLIKQKDKTKTVTGPDYFLEQHYNNELAEELQTGSLKTYLKYIEQHRKDEPGGLDTYYVIEKLRQMCLTANDNNVFGTRLSIFYQAQVLQLAGQNFSDEPFVQAYLSVYRLLTGKKQDEYFNLKKIIDRHGYDFEDANLAELFTYARNFCIARVNAGHTAFFEELFELYDLGLKKRALLLDGEINERNYKNIVTTALRTQKFDWALQFINDYRYQLNKAVRDNAYHYNLANYYFHVRQYDKGLRYLQKVQLSDLFYGLDARSLMLKCYFELDEKEAFLNACYSFRVFIGRRKNVSLQHRNNYQNFLRLAKKLMNLRPRNKAAVQKLHTEIEAAKAIADKNWLQQKLQPYL